MDITFVAVLAFVSAAYAFVLAFAFWCMVRNAISEFACAELLMAAGD